MGAFFRFIGDCFEAFFTIVPILGKFMNLALFIIGFIAAVAWIVYMVQCSRGKGVER